MSKGSKNLKSKNSHSTKPYDVSQSFVSKVASRVSELLPQRTWLNRWLSPDVSTVHDQHLGSVQVHHPSSTPAAAVINSRHSDVSADLHGPGPSKRPRLPFNSPPIFVHNKFLPNSPLHEEEISPIGAPKLSNNDSAVAGPSGLCQFNKKINFTPTSAGSSFDRPHLKLEDKFTAATQQSVTDKLNGGDDCSETSESTSGCSSLVPQAQTSQIRRSESRHLNLPGNKNNASGAGRSLFLGPSSPKIDLSSLHRRRPSFDTTTFTSSSRFMHNSSSMAEASSPFYNGRTTYGGASAYNTSTISSPGLFSQTPRRLGVTVRPVNANKPSEPSLSTTAKKILDTLEQFSSPVADAKRMSVIPGSKRKLERYNELNLPTTADLLRVKRKERLQKSTSAARQASLSSSYHRDTKSTDFEPAVYRLRNDEDGEGKRTTKLTRKNEMEAEPLEKVNLPVAVLPVEMLPKIDIPVPPRPKTAIVTNTFSSNLSASSVKNAAVVCAANTGTGGGVSSSSGSGSVMPVNSMATNHEFKMSTPLPVQADSSSRTNLNEKFNFIFSEPIGQNSKRDTMGFSSSNPIVNKEIRNNFGFVNTVSDNKNAVSLRFNESSTSSNDIKIVENAVRPSKPTCCSSTTITTTSMTNSDCKANSPDNNSYWKCPMCMVKNSKDSYVCTACDTKKPMSTSVSSSSPLVFKPPLDTWECKECFIRNKNSLNICAACNSSKTVYKPTVSSSRPVSSAPVSTSVEPVTFVSSVVGTSVSSVTSTTVTTGFGDKFKPASDTWECKECFVRNKNASDKCISCGVIKVADGKTEVKSTGTIVTSGFGDAFKKPEGSWECSMCMIRNDSKQLKCLACETIKPGAEKVITNTSVTNSSGFSFGIPASSNTGTGFSLPSGVTNSSDKEGNKTALGFQFGGTNVNSLTNSNVSANFTFGIPVTKPSVNDTDSSPKEKNSKFINDKLPHPQKEASKSQSKQSSNSQSNFKFGVDPDKCSDKQENVVKDGAASSKTLIGAVEVISNNNKELTNKTDNLFKNNNQVTTTNTFVFSAKASVPEKINSSSDKSNNFIFQSKMDQPMSGGTNLSFGNLCSNVSQSETKSASQSDVFTFGSSAKSIPAFSMTTTQSNTNPMFVFGSGTATNDNKSNSVFGSTNDSVQNQTLSITETKPVFGATKEPSPIFGSTKLDVKSPGFGGNSVNDMKPPLSSNPTNNTNVPTTYSAPSSLNTGTSGFKPENTPSTTPSFLTFRSNAAAPSFQTPVQSNSQQPEKSLFVVNKANTVPTTQSSGFSFGGGTSATNTNTDLTNKPTFGFGSGPSQTSSSSGFSFLPSSTTPAQNFNFTAKEGESSAGFNFQPAATPVQNSQAPAPVFGVQNPAPSFGSNSSLSSVFSFGAHSAQPQPQPASNAPVFGFNSSQESTPAAPPNAFVFGSANTESNQTSQPAPVPAFDPNARPTFNFTGGSTPSFTATPSPLSSASIVIPLARRPIKKAVRRSGQIR